MANNVSNVGPNAGGIYTAGSNKTAQRSNVYGSLELQTVWSGASSASLTLANPSERLFITNSTATNAVSVNFNTSTAANANAGANLVIPPLVAVEVPLTGVASINHIASSGSIRLTVANYY